MAIEDYFYDEEIANEYENVTCRDCGERGLLLQHDGTRYVLLDKKGKVHKCLHANPRVADDFEVVE